MTFLSSSVCLRRMIAPAVASLAAVLVGCAPLTDLQLSRYRDDRILKEYRYALGEQYLEVDGLRMCYQEMGQGDTLIVLPGLGTSIDFWQLNLPALAEEHHVIALDLPGFGKSGKPDADYDLLWICNKVLAFMDAKHLKRVSLMGGSMGGHLSLLLALNHPDRVEKIVMVGSCGAWPTPGVLMHLTFKFLWRDRVVADHMRRNWPKIFRRLVKEQTPMTRRLFQYQMAVRAVGRFYASEGRAASRALASIFYNTCRHRLGDVVQPVLLVWGEHDFIHPPKDGAYMARHLPNSSFVVVDGAQHAVMIDEPDLFNELVLRFLREGAVDVAATTGSRGSPVALSASGGGHATASK